MCCFLPDSEPLIDHRSIQWENLLFKWFSPIQWGIKLNLHPKNQKFKISLWNYNSITNIYQHLRTVQYRYPLPKETSDFEGSLRRWYGARQGTLWGTYGTLGRNQLIREAVYKVTRFFWSWVCILQRSWMLITCWNTRIIVDGRQGEIWVFTTFNIWYDLYPSESKLSNGATWHFVSSPDYLSNPYLTLIWKWMLLFIQLL